jgi:hypothetical protein
MDANNLQPSIAVLSMQLHAVREGITIVKVWSRKNKVVHPEMKYGDKQLRYSLKT